MRAWVVRLLEPRSKAHVYLHSDAYPWIARVSNAFMWTWTLLWLLVHIDLARGGAVCQVCAVQLGWSWSHWLLLWIWIPLVISAMLPLLFKRVICTERGLWQVGNQIEFVPFDRIRMYAWNQTSIVFDVGWEWPVQIELPTHESAVWLQTKLEQLDFPSEGTLRVVDEPSDMMLFPRIQEARWRIGLGYVYMFLWTWAMWSLATQVGASASTRTSSFFSWTSLVFFVLGLWVARCVSRWLPTWLWCIRTDVQIISEKKKSAWLFFGLVALPTFWMMFVESFLLIQMWLGPTQSFSMVRATGHMTMLAIGCFLWIDPTGAVEWKMQKDGVLWIRRLGWIECCPTEAVCLVEENVKTTSNEEDGS